MKKLFLAILLGTLFFVVNFSTVEARVHQSCRPAQVNPDTGHTECPTNKFLCSVDDNPANDYCCNQPRQCVLPDNPPANPDPNQNPGDTETPPDPDKCIDAQGNIVTGCFLLSIDPLNPLVNKNNNFFGQIATWITFQTPGGVLNKLIPFLFVFAGLILFVMILWGGFEMLMGAADAKSQESGKQRITAAITGFILLFISYWIAQIVQFIFGVNVLG